MLVLTRKEMESVRLGNGVTVQVRAIRGNRVVLGFEAPANIRVLRGELPDFELEFGAETDALHSPAAKGS